jgi:hypothetical protein
MSNLINWDDVDSGSKAGGKGENDKYLKLSGSTQGNVYKIRPVGKPCTFYAYYVSNPDEPKKFARAFTEDPQNCVIRQKYNLEAKPRYAVNVIDRADGKLKIMEAPSSVFEKIKAWAKAAGQDPGSKNGADFQITVKLPANGDKKRTEYLTTPIIQTPFSDDEKEMLRSKGLWDLEKEFAPTPQSEIEAKLYGSKAKTSSAASSSAPAKAAAASANDPNDLGF